MSTQITLFSGLLLYNCLSLGEVVSSLFLILILSKEFFCSCYCYFKKKKKKAKQTLRRRSNRGETQCVTPERTPCKMLGVVRSHPSSILKITHPFRKTWSLQINTKVRMKVELTIASYNFFWWPHFHSPFPVPSFPSSLVPPHGLPFPCISLPQFNNQ